jgi:hypothetical protein
LTKYRLQTKPKKKKRAPHTHTQRQSLRKPSKRSSPWLITYRALLLLLIVVVVVVIVPGAHRRVHAAGVVKDPRN